MTLDLLTGTQRVRAYAIATEPDHRPPWFADLRLYITQRCLSRPEITADQRNTVLAAITRLQESLE